MNWTEYLHSANWNQASALCLFAYVLGCFTAGYYLVRFHAGKDIRRVGSGSVGARNVSRVLGKTGFVLTVLSDLGKGALAVWVARHFTGDERLVALTMVAVVAGHVWPAQLRFHGGKGMATSLGALLVFDPQLALTFAVLFLCLAGATRRVVLPSLCAMAAVPLAAMARGDDPVEVVVLCGFAAVVLIGHRRNVIEETAEFFRRHLHPETHQSEP